MLDLFTRQHLSYLLFKCDHIFEGQNKNLDILFQTKEDYQKAAIILEQQGFVVRLSEKIEKYKTMYCGLIDKTMYSIHLHREIAWHGMVALDKQPVFGHAQHLNHYIIIPNIEDSILIHAAHVLFENFKVKEREKNYFLKLNEPSEGHLINHKYIDWQIRKNHWEKGFWKVIKSEQLSKIEIGWAWINKLIREPETAFYLFKKALRIPLRKLSFKRQGCLIALIGINGSGKSTLSRKVLEMYLPCTRHLGKEQYYYYYGWNPRFFLTKIGSSLLQKKKKSVFQETALQQNTKKFDIFQELLFMYITMEYFYRYWIDIRPKLRQNSVVVTDRYFYDLYGQYPYAQKSVLFSIFMKIFPKPDFTYLLIAPLAQIASREKTDRNKQDTIVNLKRKVLPQEYLIQLQCPLHALLQMNRTKNTLAVRRFH